MAMTVANNNATALALGELNKNTNKLTKDLKKVSTGTKITGASDGASEFAQSEKLRTLVRALGQDIENSQKGITLVKTAEGGIQGIIDSLRTMKELALNSFNDHNSEEDRKILQKEFSARMAEIDELASTTNYNGKILLDGRYWYTEYMIKTDIHGSNWSSDGNGNNGQTGADLIDDTGNTGRIVSEPTGDAKIIPSGKYTISTDGVYILANWSCDVTINAENVKIVQLTSATLKDIYIKGPTSGNANLWLENINVNNTKDANFIRFSGVKNNLSIKGTNTINTTYGPYNDAWESNRQQHAIINVGGGLTIEGDGALNFTGHMLNGASIGSDANEMSSAYITINSGTFNTDNFRSGALIGTGLDASIGDIHINGGTFTDNSDKVGTDCLIGGGSTEWDIYNLNGYTYKTGNIYINNATISATNSTAHYIDPVIGTSGVPTRDIYVSNSTINYRGRYASGIGTIGAFISPPPNVIVSTSYTGDITVENCDLHIYSEAGAGIGSGQRGKVGDIDIINCTGSVKSLLAEDIGKGVRGEAGRVRIINSPQLGDDTDNSQTDDDTSTNDDSSAYNQENANIFTWLEGNPLIIHTGPKANQHLRIYINDMRTKAMGLEDAAVDPQEKAVEALEKLDSAVEYALNENVRMGAYQVRLEETIDNLITAQENAIHSESVIRDADMAKAIMSYTKNNILAQAAQAMLAQANQNAGNVLGLLG